MGNNFARKLQELKLYRKRYNQRGTKYQLIFRNGMNLRRLADEMGEKHWVRYGVWSVHENVLSDVIYGKRLFTFVQFEIFCEVLELSATTQEALNKALQEDRKLRHEAHLKKRSRQ